MINLLPDEKKEQLQYARKNRSLIIWCASILVSVVGMFGLLLFGSSYIANSESQLSTSLDISNQRIEASGLVSDQLELEKLSNKLKTVVTILSKQVLFSELLPRMGSILPDGVLLRQINVSSDDQGLSLELLATEARLSATAQLNLESAENNIFEKADIESVDCSLQPSSSGAPSLYPCTITMRVLFKQNSDFFFFNTVTNTDKKATESSGASIQ